MKNAIIYSFSGTGNTARICKLYKEEFERNGVETTVYKVTADMSDVPSPSDFEYVGFAYPIHAFNAPSIMNRLAKALPKAEGKEYFVIKSSGEPLRINNISSYKMRKLLKRRGYTQFAEYHYIMPYNMIFRHTDTMATRMWQTAEALAPIEAREVLAGERHTLKGVPFGHFIAWVLRIEHSAMRVNGRMFRIDKNKCTQCGACVRNCPVGNIKLEDGKFKFGGDCLMCARCSFNCQTDAFNIALLNGWRVNGKYNLSYDGEPQPPTHAWYCKKAYIRYFSLAEEKINKDKNNCLQQQNLV